MSVKNIVTSVAAVLGSLALMLAACNKPKPISISEEASIYMPQSVDTRADLLVYYIDTLQSYTYGADYGGLKQASSDITVTFAVDTAAISAYNIANGTNYVVLPDSTYTLSGLSTTIPAGQTESAPLTLTITSAKKQLHFSTQYMLPITIKSVSSGHLDSTTSTTYFRIDSLQTRQRDITALGTLSVLVENSDPGDTAEWSPHLVDNDITTKYLTFSFPQPFWYQLLFASGEEVDSYTMTSANDTPTRDPLDWVFKASNDGNTWVTIDSVTNASFPAREQTIEFKVANPGTYLYYRMYITANGGDALFQQAEWRLLQYY